MYQFQNRVSYEVSIGVTNYSCIFVLKGSPVVLILVLGKIKSKISVSQEANIFNEEIKHLDTSL